MTKKILSLAIVILFALSAVSAYTGKACALDNTKDRASKAMNNMLYGPTEIAKNLNETNSKGTKVEGCTEKTRTGVERGLARLGTGIWQLATFWYSDPGCGEPTSTSQASSSCSETTK